jgi:hypothetical protein
MPWLWVFDFQKLMSTGSWWILKQKHKEPAMSLRLPFLLMKSHAPRPHPLSERLVFLDVVFCVCRMPRLPLRRPLLGKGGMPDHLSC